MTKSDSQVLDFHTFAMEKEAEAIAWMKKEYYPRNHALVQKIEKKHDEFVINREGETMPEDYVEGYLGAAKYDYDRASYKIYRPLIEKAELVYTE